MLKNEYFHLSVTGSPSLDLKDIMRLKSLKEATPQHWGQTCRLLLAGDDDGCPGRLAVLLQSHVELEQVLGVLTGRIT